MQAVSGQQVEEISNDMNYVVERLDADDYENTNYEDTTYVQEDEEEDEEDEEVTIENEVQEEIIEEAEVEVGTPVKKIRLQKVINV
jgi:ribonucleotide reductase alpha subunit